VTFFALCFVGTVGFDNQLTDSSLASILFVSAGFSGGFVLPAYTNKLQKIRKFLFYLNS
jgi:hypothetical protein